ncbi:MAG: DEAD/DEAH box helicase [Phycisphaerae bacterium]
MDVRGLLKEITAASSYRGQIVHVREVPARQARFAAPARELDETIASILRRNNIYRLYSHQAAALDADDASESFLVVTATASGKTLCYTLPVVRKLAADPDARALYLFPTKALTQDQQAALMRWAGREELAEKIRPAVYDGDTPSHKRTAIRNQANILLTNPDMLHVGILPYHGRWHAFLRQLKYIVIDEIHTYRGIFGSHVACVLRRLLRLCAHYGSNPQIIGSSATIANPVELAETLTGRQMRLIDNDGSPRGRKFFVLWNPPTLDEDNVTRRSGNVEAVDLLTALVRRRAQTIVFGKARVVVELIYRYAKEQLAGEGDLAGRIRPYRGGFLPGERREIEKLLFSGQLLGVTATNALELGIDVGKLDAAILVGFPGTICSTWQQAGRAGRSQQDSLVILVGYDDPIDQYLMRHPDYLFGSAIEEAVIDPANPHILAGQLSCACFEKPLTGEDEAWFGPLVRQVGRILAEEGQVKDLDGRLYWRSRDFPARTTNLRTISEDTYAIVNTDKAQTVIGNVDSISAPELVYPGAVYLHEGQSYLVDQLDQEAKMAMVRPVEVDYYTQPILASSCRLLEAQETAGFLDGQKWFGPADVTWQTTAFRKIKYYTMEMVGQSELDLPAQTLSTTGFWWIISGAMRQQVAAAGHKPIEALVGLRNLMLVTLPVLAMSDRRDLSGMVDSANLGQPTIFIYDRYPGGLGFAQHGYERLTQWLGLCRQIVAECPCQGGCPSCVGLANLRPPLHQDPDLGGQNFPVPDKAATISLLDLLEKAGGLAG